MNLRVFAHNNPEKIVDTKLMSELEKELKSISINFREGGSRQVRDRITDRLLLLGWSEKIGLEHNTNISITSYNKGHGLCLQTGNMSRFYADLLKLEYLFKSEKIFAAFYLLPDNEEAKALGSNIANFDRFVRELTIFKDIIRVPIIVYGLRK